MIHFALCKEQQHSQKKEFFCDYDIAEAPLNSKAEYWSMKSLKIQARGAPHSAGILSK
jgi:hypothetical protein